MKKNLVWIIDIDGTILNVHKNQVPAWNAALQESFGFIPDEKVLISFFGKPFNSVLKNVAKAHGVSDEKIDKNLVKARDTYIREVTTHLEKMGGNVLPGALEFLQELQNLGITKAIATGNPVGEGEHKLKHFGIFDFFNITVFAEDRAERIEMVNEVVRQAKEKFHHDLDNKKRIIVIGDSKHDIESAKQIGATAVGVTTGHTSKNDLKKAGAEFVFDGLADYKKVIETVQSSIK